MRAMGLRQRPQRVTGSRSSNGQALGGLDPNSIPFPASWPPGLLISSEPVSPSLPKALSGVEMVVVLHPHRVARVANRRDHPSAGTLGLL